MGISTHVLDTSTGRPGVGVAVTLGRGAEVVAQGVTDGDGRCRLVMEAAEAGVYALRFETGAYYAGRGVAGLYPWVEICFTVVAGETHYHIPLLLTANGYTTYRGS